MIKCLAQAVVGCFLLRICCIRKIMLCRVAFADVYYLANEENLNFEHVNKNTAVKTSTLVTPADGMIIIRGLAGGSYTVLPKTAASALSCSSRWAHWL